MLLVMGSLSLNVSGEDPEPKLSCWGGSDGVMSCVLLRWYLQTKGLVPSPGHAPHHFGEN